MKNESTYSQNLRCISCTAQSHSFKACDKYITTPDCSADKLKFCRTDWEFGFITVNSEREKQLFPNENLKKGFWSQENSSSYVICLYVFFSFPQQIEVTG